MKTEHMTKAAYLRMVTSIFAPGDSLVWNEGENKIYHGCDIGCSSGYYLSEFDITYETVKYY